MSNSLSADLLASLVQNGTITPAQAQAYSQQQQPFGAGFGGAGLQLPPAGPPAAPPAQAAAPPGMPPRPSSMEAAANAAGANNESAQRLMAQMTPEQRAASIQTAGQGFQSRLAGINGPRLQPQASPPPAGPVQGVFADQGGAMPAAQPFQYTGGGGAGGAGGVLPAHAVSTVSPETRALFGEADAAKMDAAKQGEEAEVAASENEAAGALNIRDKLAEQKEAMDRAEERRTKAYNEQWDDYQKLRKEAASGKIEKPDVGLMGHIAMALGAGGAALTHSPNFAMEMINKRIDDNIATQRANIEGKREAAKGSLEGLGQMRARFGDERVGEAAERARQLEEAKATGDVMVAQSKSPMLAAKWAGIRANIDAEQAQQHGALEKWMPAQALAGGNKLQALAQKLYEKNYGHPGNTVEAAQQEAAKLLNMGQGGEAPVISGAPKGTGGAMSPRLARRMADLDASDKAAARLQALLGRTGGSFSLADRAQAEADATVLRNAGHTSVPEHPLQVISSAGARSAGVAEVRRAIAQEKAALSKYGGGSEEGGSEGENADEFIKPAGKE